jgi:hypothetical protein
MFDIKWKIVLQLNHSISQTLLPKLKKEAPIGSLSVNKTKCRTISSAVWNYILRLHC